MAKKLLGVGFLPFSIVDGVAKVFTVRELKSKPAIHKHAGMISFPFETFEESDIDPLGTIRRIPEEEMGISPNLIEVCDIIPDRFNLIEGRPDIDTVYGYGILLSDPYQKFQPKDNDIAFAGWKTLEELRQDYIRVETGPIIDHFLQHSFDQLVKRLSKAA